MWLKVDDGMLDHPKWRRAVRAGGCATVHLWLALGTWCARHLTDGRVPVDMVSEVGGPRGKRTRERALRVLAECQLVVTHVSGDVQLNDYLAYNPSRDEVQSERARKAKNKESWMLRKNGTGSEPVENRAGIAARPVPVPVPVPVPDPERAKALLSSSAPPAPDALPVVRDVFDEWRRVHSKPRAKLDPKRISRIRSGLKLRSADELKQAIRGALKDDWLMGRDPKSTGKYDELHTILRDAAQIERLIDLETGKTKPIRRSAPGVSLQRDEGVDVMGKFFKGVQ